MFQRTAFGKCLGFRSIVLRSPAKVILQHSRWFFAHRRAPSIAQSPTRLRHPTALLPPGLLDEGGGGTEGGGRKTQPEPERNERKPTSILVAELVLEWSSSSLSSAVALAAAVEAAVAVAALAAAPPTHSQNTPAAPRSSKVTTVGKSQCFIVPLWGTSQGGTITHNSPAAPAAAK